MIGLWIDGVGAVRRLESSHLGDVDRIISEFHRSLRSLRLPSAPPAHMPQRMVVALLTHEAAVTNCCPSAATPPGIEYEFDKPRGLAPPSHPRL